MTYTICPTCHRKRTRSSEANRRYWAILWLYSEKKTVEGKKYSPTVWHVYFREKHLGMLDISLPNGRTIQEPVSTSGLTTSEFNDYMTLVERDAAEDGVYLED